MSFVCGYGILLLGAVDKRQAVAPSGPTLCGQGRFFVLLTVWERRQRQRSASSGRNSELLLAQRSDFCKRPCGAPQKPAKRKRIEPMVTFSDLVQIGILIVGAIELVLHLIELDRNKRQ